MPAGIDQSSASIEDGAAAPSSVLHAPERISCGRLSRATPGRTRLQEPAGDLLGRPIQSELFRNGPPQPRIGGQFTTFRTTSPFPGLLIGRRRAVTIIAAIAADLPAHRRGRAAQQPGYRSRRLIERYSSGYFLALCKCQCQPWAAPWRGTNSSVWGQLKINGR